MLESKWKGSEDVERLIISQKKIGRGVYGTVYVGSLKFKGRPRLRVAVKRFRKPLTDERVERFKKVIETLRQKKLPIPKTGFVKHEGQWVQVMHLFKNKAGSKIKNAFDFPIQLEKYNEIFQLIVEVINAGYSPARDMIGAIQTKQGTHFILHDLDLLEEEQKEREQNNLKALRNRYELHLYSWAHWLSTDTGRARADIFQKLKRSIKNEKALAALETLIKRAQKE